MKMLQGGEEEQRLTMATRPNAYVLPTIERAKTIFARKAGQLLIPDRLWLETAHVVSMLSSEPLISNIFYSIKLKNDTAHRRKALCLWLNTTWGMLTTLASREETRGGFLSLKMSQWRLLPVLNIDQLNPAKITALAAVFDRFQTQDFGRIPQQFAPTGRHLRTEFDLAFLTALGIHADEADLDSIYDDLSASLKQWLGE